MASKPLQLNVDSIFPPDLGNAAGPLSLSGGRNRLGSRAVPAGMAIDGRHSAQ